MVHMEYFRSIFILSATAFIVYIDVQINKWFGEFYDVLQKALSDPGSVSLEEFLGWLYKFAKLAAIYIIVLIFSDFFTSHYTFDGEQLWLISIIINGIKLI